MIPKKVFKKIFFRFCKEHGIYSFIIGEIKKEHGNFNKFYKVADEEGLVDVFNKTTILSFQWYDDVEFWRNVHKEWKKTYYRACDLYS